MRIFVGWYDSFFFFSCLGVVLFPCFMGILLLCCFFGFDFGVFLFFEIELRVG